MNYRRNDYDVTNTVQVSSPDAVLRAVRNLFAETWPQESFDRLDTAFADFEKLFTAKYPGYHGCDTAYHDMQHSLDVTLAAARLCVAHDRVQPANMRIGPSRSLVCVICALFHDSGYMRELHSKVPNGAFLTKIHVSRSVEFLTRYLRVINLTDWIPMMAQILHFTGYEVSFDLIHLDDQLDRTAGHLLGTADLIAQMSDRCYLEKCRDRLYPEFVLAGIAVPEDTVHGQVKVIYSTGLDVLRSTPKFFEEIRRTRLDGEYQSAYQHLNVLFNGHNPYMEAIDGHLKYLKDIMRTQRWPLLRRDPPCFAWENDVVKNMRLLANAHLKQLWARY